jgi:hypothetical protein
MEGSMKRLLILVLFLSLFVDGVHAESDCYMVAEDAPIGDSENTWEIANVMLKKQEMDKLTRLFLEEKIAVLKEGEKLHVINRGTTLHEIRLTNEDKRWFIATEVVRPCPK